MTSTSPRISRRGLIAGGVAAAALPAFLRRAFACPPAIDVHVERDCPAPTTDIDVVTVAYRAAVAVGKPLLVILVPDDAGRKYDRGHLWGEVLNHAAPSTWEALACCEVVCGSNAAVRQLLNIAVDDDALFAFVETNAVPAVARAVVANVPAYESRLGRGFDTTQGTWEDAVKREREVSEQRIAIVGALVEASVFGAPALGSTVRPLLAQRVADARVRNVGINDDDARAAALVVLGEGARAITAAQARLKLKPVRGSKWASSGGCGVDVEGEDDNVGIACGMGHTPELSRRFLYWFKKGE
jgi:hypothetical protein